jgi:RNA polymerase sigma-70 factor (ECF subfamily)
MTNRLPADMNASGSKDAQEDAIDVLLAQGDDSAFEELVRSYQGYVSLLVYRLLGWSPDVEDIVQEVFLAAFNNFRKFRGRSGVKTWLTVIAVNKCRSYHRRRWLLKRFLGEQSHRKAQAEAHNSSGLMERERDDHVRQAVASLKGPLREVTVLRYLQELPTGQVADVLGISPGAVEVRLHRARAKLRQVLSGLVKD